MIPARGDRVAVTGASGFIGSAITRRLLEAGAKVVAVADPAGDQRNLEGLDVQIRRADVRDSQALRRTLEGCRYVFHTAAVYGFWARNPAVFYEVNVGGTRNLLDAAVAHGCERIVYTGTVGTLGLGSTGRGVPANEDSVADVAHLFGPYKRSKYVAEHEVLRAGAQGVPVVLVLPTFPLGPRDSRPTPTGRVVLDFLNGRIPGYVETSVNVAHVDDVAHGHLLALERGRLGRSYIVGGENITMRGLLDTVASVAEMAPVSCRVPRALALGAGIVSEAVQGRLMRREPFVAFEAARMSATNMIFDDTRARDELGHASRPAVAAIEDSVRWFIDRGYVASRGRRSRIPSC